MKAAVTLALALLLLVDLVFLSCLLAFLVDLVAFIIQLSVITLLYFLFSFSISLIPLDSCLFFPLLLL